MSSPGITESTAYQEVANKLDLAKVYIEMDDAAAAREFLEEVLREGNAEQISSAKAMLSKLG
jgi:pilus assembly protein FimV